MTGNNKVWRASLAGLASVAMLATMGVVAGTANAAAADNYKVTVDGNTVAVWPGETLADAINREGTTLKYTAGGYVGTKNDGFIGYTLNGAAVNFNDPKAITGDVTLKTETIDATDYVPVTFDLDADSAQLFNGQKVDTSVILNVRKGETLGAARGPVDAANQKVVKTWTITETNDKGTIVVKDQTLADVENYNVASAKEITVTPQVVENSGFVRFAQPANWARVAHLSGSYSDGSANDAEYVVDAQAGTEVQAPSYVFDATTDDKFDYLAGWQSKGGTQYAADAKVKAVEGELALTPVTPTTGVVVKFDSNGGSAVAPQYVNEKGTVTKPADPTKANYTFAGWKINPAEKTSGKIVETAENSINADNYLVAFDGVIFTDSVTLTADWVPSYQIRVTFHYGDYPNAPKDESKLYAPTDYVTKPADPTREGFVFDGWNKADGTPYKFETTLVANGGSTDNNNFVLTAAWKRVYNKDVEAALNYVQDGTDFPGAEKTGGKVQDDSAYFTEASFKEYQVTYLKAIQDYQAALYTAQNNEIDSTTSAAIVNSLNAALKKLQFKHDGGLEPTTAGKLQAIHRLYRDPVNGEKTGEHFYSNTQNEIKDLTSTQSTSGNWKDEGPLFYVNTKADFAEAPTGIDAITTAYVRFFNPSTRDHVWTAVDGEEDQALSADKTWNREGIAFYAPTFTGSVDVVRLYNGDLNRHLLSSSSAEQSILTASGWKVEGVAAKGI